MIGTRPDEMRIERSLPHGHVAAALGMLRRIALDRLILSAAKDAESRRHCDLVVAMIVDRLITPRSKLGFVRAVDQETATSSLGAVLRLGEVKEREAYESLDWLLERQQRIENGLCGTRHRLARLHALARSLGGDAGRHPRRPRRERRPDALSAARRARGSRRSARRARSDSIRARQPHAGKRADMTVVSLAGSPYDPVEDPSVAAVFGGSPAGVLETIVNGQTRYRQGETAWHEVHSTASAARARMLG